MFLFATTFALALAFATCWELMKITPSLHLVALVEEAALPLPSLVLESVI